MFAFAPEPGTHSGYSHSFPLGGQLINKFTTGQRLQIVFWRWSWDTKVDHMLKYQVGGRCVTLWCLVLDYGNFQFFVILETNSIFHNIRGILAVEKCHLDAVAVFFFSHPVTINSLLVFIWPYICLKQCMFPWFDLCCFD